MQLDTQRLILKPAPEVTAQVIHEAIQESLPEMQRFMFWAQKGYTLADAETYLELARKGWHTQKKLSFAMVERTSGRFAGLVGLEEGEDISTPRVPFYTLGWWCRTSMAGKGYTTEAAEMLLSHAFTVRGAQRVDATVSSENKASQRVMEKLGMQREACLKNTRRNYWDGQLADTFVYAIFPA